MSAFRGCTITKRDVRRSYSYSDQSAANVIRELKTALFKLEAVHPQVGPVRVEDVGLVAEAFNAISNLDNWLPRIMCWTCGYPYKLGTGLEKAAEGDELWADWSSWSGHPDRETAERWLVEWKKVGESFRFKETWMVRLAPIPVTHYVAGDVDPVAALEGMFR